MASFGLRNGVRFELRTIFFVLVAVAATAPAWIVRHPPLQDLPTHLAILRLIHSYGDPAYGLQEDFSLNLLHTQYLLYYVVGSALAYVLGVVKANVALMSLYLGGTVLATRALLSALGKDERLCIFVLPLLVNVMFLLGFLPFLLGIPLCLLGLAVAIRYVEEPTRRRAVVLGAIAVGLFVLHLFPFALFGLGFIAIFPWDRPRAWLRAGLPVTPALALLAVWALTTETARRSMGTLKGEGGRGGVAPLDTAIRESITWSTNVFTDTSDEGYLILLALVALLALGLAQGDRDAAKPISRGYAFLPIACAALYFMTGDHIGDVWLFSQRFPILAMITAVPLLRMPRGLRGVVVTGAALAVGLGSIVNVCKHYIDFERNEVGDIDDAIDAMQPRRKVAALIYDKGSSLVNLAPFLHFGSYYQVEKGGVIQFSNANIEYSPFHFKPDRLPPQGQPARLRWEWTPEQVSIQELFPYYDYVLTRGSGFHPPAGSYHLKWHGSRWAVWEKG